MISVDRINGVTGDLAIKTPVRVATTANITLEGLQTIDGVALAADDRVLVKNQTTAASNGIWVANTSAWSRALDFDGRFDVVRGTLIEVVSGTLEAGSVFRLDTDSPVIGTSALTFTRTHTVNLEADLASTASGKGAALVGWIRSAASAVATTVAARLGWFEPCVFEFLTAAKVLDVQTDAATLDTRAAIAAADTAGPFVFYKGTYKVSSNITIANAVEFKPGAKLSIDTGVVVTFSGTINAPHSTLFTGLGTVVFGADVAEAYPEWFGALGKSSGIDFPAIQRCLTACATNKVVTYLGQDYYGSAGGGSLNVTPSTPINTAPGVIVSGIDQNTFITFTTGNYLGMRFNLPALTGFASDAIKAVGTSLLDVYCPMVANGNTTTSNGVNIVTQGGAMTSLDNRFEVFIMGPNLANGFVVTGAGAGSVIQGNECYCNFTTSVKTSVLYFETAGGTAWDGNQFVFQAIDPFNMANATGLANASATSVPRCTFRVESWMGGFGGAGAKWVTGLFGELDCYIRPANNLTAYTQFQPVGIAGRISLGNSGFDSVTALFAVGTVAGVGLFNGGVPITLTRFACSYTVPGGGIAAGGFVTLYAYSPFVDFTARNIKIEPANMAGLMVDAVAKTGVTNEMTIGLRNVSGGAIAAGSLIIFYVSVGD